MLNDTSEGEERIAGGGDDGRKNERRLSDVPPLSTDFERGRKGRMIERQEARRTWMVIDSEGKEATEINRTGFLLSGLSGIHVSGAATAESALGARVKP
jgi:hypothetical protein